MVKPYIEMYKSIRMNVFVSLALKAMLLTTFNTSNNVKEFTWMTFLSYFIYFQCVLRSAVCCWLVSLSPRGSQVVATNSIAAKTSSVAAFDYMGPRLWTLKSTCGHIWPREHTLKATSNYIGVRLGTHTEINLWLHGTKARNTEISLWLHHQGCLNNPIFWNLGLYAACWAHFACHDELWATSMSHPSSLINRKTLPVKYYSYLWTSSSKFCSPTLLSLYSFLSLSFSPYFSLWEIIFPMCRLWLRSLYGLSGPLCPPRQLNWITQSLTHHLWDQGNWL